MDMFVRFDAMDSEPLPSIWLGDLVYHPYQPLRAAVPVPLAANDTAPPRARFHYLSHLSRIARLGLGIGPRQLAISLAAALRARHVVATIVGAMRESTFRQQLQARPEIWGMIRSSFMSARWSAEQRIARVIDHCRFIARLGPLFDFRADSYVDLLRLGQIGSDYRVTLDQPRWMLKEGQLALTIWEGPDRLFSICFSLSAEAGGTAYVGGLQGGKAAHGLDRQRQLTKAAHGMRPRDLTIELFRMLCGAIGVKRILGVSDDIHAWQRPVLSATCEELYLRYDEAWSERGGQRREDGFFLLPVAPNRRADEDIPARKRALYRRRYAMLESIDGDLKATLDAGLTADRLKRHAALAIA